MIRAMSLQAGKAARMDEWGMRLGQRASFAVILCNGAAVFRALLRVSC